MAKNETRTQLYIRMLTRKSGATAQELEAAVIAAGMAHPDHYTRHNSYSLALFGSRKGFDLYWDRTADKNGIIQDGANMRYQFLPAGTPASKVTAWGKLSK